MGDAFHGLAGDVVRTLEPHTEADPAGLLIQFIIAFGNLIGRMNHWIVGGEKHFDLGLAGKGEQGGVGGLGVDLEVDWLGVSGGGEGHRGPGRQQTKIGRESTHVEGARSGTGDGKRAYFPSRSVTW